MITSSSGNIFRVIGPFCGESTGQFPAQRQMTRSFDVFFVLGLNKRLNKQSRRRWFETPSRSSWRHRNDTLVDGSNPLYGSVSTRKQIEMHICHRFNKPSTNIKIKIYSPTRKPYKHTAVWNSIFCHVKILYQIQKPTTNSWERDLS